MEECWQHGGASSGDGLEWEIEDIALDVSNAIIGIVEVENRIGSPRLLAVASIADGSNVKRAVSMDLHLFLCEVVGTQRTMAQLVKSPISKRMAGGRLVPGLILV